MSDLTDQLERLMAFAGEDARAAFWDLPAAVCDGKSDAHSFECGARYQHQRNLEVLRRMARVIEKCDSTLKDVATHHQGKGSIAGHMIRVARAEIARLAEGGE